MIAFSMKSAFKKSIYALLIVVGVSLVQASIFGQTVSDSGEKQEGVRLKELARISGVRGNQLMGYGLVVGLPGTGDTKSAMAGKSMENLLDSMGVSASAKSLNARNIAAVIVTCELPPFAAEGDRLNATVSSVGDARSLKGGVLIQSPLYGANRNVYAVAQGQVATGGGSDNRSGKKDAMTVGMIINGVLVERTPVSPFPDDRRIQISLNRFDFSTLNAVKEKIEKEFPDLEPAVEGGSIYVSVPDKQDIVNTISSLELLRINPVYPARVVINERTGTIVMGGDVRIDPVAVSRGGMKLVVNPSVKDWRTMGIHTRQKSGEDEKKDEVLREISASSVQEVIQALNDLGADLKDIIAILEALKDSGALHAELVIL